MSFIKKLFSYHVYYGHRAVTFYFFRTVNLFKRKAYSLRKRKLYKVNFDGEYKSIGDMLGICECDAFNYLSNNDVNGMVTYNHIKTFCKSYNSHNLLSNKTFCKALINRFKTSGEEKYIDTLKDCVSYVLKKRDDTGIFKYEQALGLEQDEGPVTAGMIYVLTELYVITNQQSYLLEAINVAESAIKHLKTFDYGYVHTIGYNVLTTNVNSTFATAFFNLYLITKDSLWLEETNFCVKNVLKMQRVDGCFLYSTTNQSVYKSFYHFMVINSFTELSKKGYSNVDLTNSISRAAEFGKKLIDINGLIIESSVNYYSFFQSCTRAAITYSLLDDLNAYKKIVQSFRLFIRKHIESSIIFQNEMYYLTDKGNWYRKEGQIMDIYDDLSLLVYLEEKNER